MCVCHPSPWPGGRGGGRGGSSVSLGEGRRKHECACVCLFQLLETCLQLRAQGAQTLMHGYHPPLALIFICVGTEQNRLARSNDEHVMIRGPQRSWQAEQASAAEANTHTHTHHSVTACRLEPVPRWKNCCCWFLWVVNASWPHREQSHHCLVGDLNTRPSSLLFILSGACLLETNRDRIQSGNLNSCPLYSFMSNKWIGNKLFPMQIQCKIIRYESYRYTHN